MRKSGGDSRACRFRVWFRMAADHTRALRAALGYAELGLYDEALAELDAGRVDDSAEVDGLRLMILRRAGRWTEMRDRARQKTETDQGNYEWWIHWADATRHAEGLVKGRSILERAAAKFPGNGHILFQLACYSAQLGELERARHHLVEAVKADERWADVFHVDRDLEPLWAGNRGR